MTTRGKTLKYKSIKPRCTALQARVFAAAYVTGGQSVADGAAAVGKSVTACRDWASLPLVARAIAAIQGIPCEVPSFSLPDALGRVQECYDLAKRKRSERGMMQAIDLMAKLSGHYRPDKVKPQSIDTLSLWLREIAGRQEMPGRIGIAIPAQFEPKGAPLLDTPPVPPTVVGIGSYQEGTYPAPPCPELGYDLDNGSPEKNSTQKFTEILAFADSIQMDPTIPTGEVGDGVGIEAVTVAGDGGYEFIQVAGSGRVESGNP